MNPECAGPRAGTTRGFPRVLTIYLRPYRFLTASSICVPARIAMAGYLVPFHGTRVGPKATKSTRSPYRVHGRCTVLAETRCWLRLDAGAGTPRVCPACDARRAWSGWGMMDHGP